MRVASNLARPKWLVLLTSHVKFQRNLPIHILRGWSGFKKSSSYFMFLSRVPAYYLISTSPYFLTLQERIIPKSWLLPLYPAQWHRLLRLETEVDVGPLDLSTDDFRRSCLRCGRILLQDIDHCWRWTGFHFGVDLLISYQKRQITVKRNTGSHKCPTSVSLHQQVRVVLFRCVIASPLKVLSVGPSVRYVSWKPILGR